MTLRDWTRNIIGKWRGTLLSTPTAFDQAHGGARGVWSMPCGAYPDLGGIRPPRWPADVAKKQQMIPGHTRGREEAPCHKISGGGGHGAYPQGAPHHGPSKRDAGDDGTQNDLMVSDVIRTTSCQVGQWPSKWLMCRLVRAAGGGGANG